jgi:hypothetical protein
MNDYVAPKLDVRRDETELAGHETICGRRKIRHSCERS